MVLRNKGKKTVRVLTADGEITLSRRYFAKQGQPGLYPADALVGIASSRVTSGAKEVLCLMGMMVDFKQAAEYAKKIGNIPISKERLRQIVESEAAAITVARNEGRLKAAWNASDAKTEATENKKTITRVYLGVDGVMVPVVSQQEKEKRRKNTAVRRQQRSATGVENTRPLPPMRPGSSEKFKEMKIGLFYDQDKKHRHAFATEADSEAFGPLLKKYADQIEFEKADQSISLTDGAKWIRAQICLYLTLIGAMRLDFYHLCTHIHDAAKCCFGDTPQAKEWAAKQLKTFKEEAPANILSAIEALEKKTRAVDKRESLRLLKEFIGSRKEMLDYPQALADGQDIGSGPTEASCKTMTLRLKRSGMKWDPDHAAGMMNLNALYASGQAGAYWASAA